MFYIIFFSLTFSAASKNIQPIFNNSNNSEVENNIQELDDSNYAYSSTIAKQNLERKLATINPQGLHGSTGFRSQSLKLPMVLQHLHTQVRERTGMTGLLRRF